MELDDSHHNIGLWDFYKDEIIYKTIMSCNSEIDIVELINSINEFVELHVGKLPDLEKLSKELKFSIKNLYTSERNKKKIYEKIKNEKNEEINLHFAMEKTDNNGICFCNIFNFFDTFKCCTVRIRITISKPINLVATNLCNNFMNEKIKQTIFSKIDEGNTFVM